MGCGWLLPVTLRQEWVLAGAVFFLAYPLTQWQEEQSLVVAELGPSSRVSPRRLSEEFRFLRCVARCAVRIWKYGALFPPLFRVWPPLRMSGCCLWSTGYWIRGETASTETFERISHIFLGAVDSDPEASRSPCSCRMEKCAQSMLQFTVPFFCVARTWKSENTNFTKSTSLAVCVMIDGCLAAFFGLSLWS